MKSLPSRSPVIPAHCPTICCEFPVSSQRSWTFRCGPLRIRTSPWRSAAALALQAFFGGRKVRDPADNRTNLYLIGLAYASSGKEFPRKVNAATMHAVGLAHCLGESFASGEGLQDSLNDDPCMLFQTDEIDGLLQSINKSKDARYEIVLGTHF